MNQKKLNVYGFRNLDVCLIIDDNYIFKAMDKNEQKFPTKNLL